MGKAFMSQAFIGRLRMFVPNVVAYRFAEYYEYYWGISECVFGGCLWPCALRGACLFCPLVIIRVRKHNNSSKLKLG